MESFLTDAAEQGTNEVLGRWHTEELYLNSLRIGLGVIRKTFTSLEAKESIELYLVDENGQVHLLGDQ